MDIRIECRRCNHHYNSFQFLEMEFDATTIIFFFFSIQKLTANKRITDAQQKQQKFIKIGKKSIAIVHFFRKTTHYDNLFIVDVGANRKICFVIFFLRS